MPTGYTSGVAVGKVTDFREFALQCARAFGACISLSDESSDTPIPEEFKPDSANSEKVLSAIEAKDKAYAMTLAEAEFHLIRHNAKQVEARQDCIRIGLEREAHLSRPWPLQRKRVGRMDRLTWFLNWRAIASRAN